MIKESRVSKYLLYALGEIILVVIGILIALQINNWNEEKKNAIMEAEYYCRLLEDLQQDTEQTNALIEQAENRLKASNQAIRLLSQNETKSITIGQYLGLSTKAIYIDFKPNNSTFEDLKSSNLSIIKDKSIIKALNNYYNTIESLKSIIMINGEHAVDVAFENKDGFSTGETQASMLHGNLAAGMEPDVRDLFPLDTNEVLSSSTQRHLLDQALIYLASNTRQLELYRIIKEYSTLLTSMLQEKCMNDQ
jgi:hypothetical protein